MFIPYFVQYAPKQFSTSVKPGNPPNRSFLGENNKLGKIEDIENGIKNKMELQKANLKKIKRSDPKKAETAQKILDQYLLGEKRIRSLRQFRKYITSHEYPVVILYKQADNSQC